MSRMLDHYKKVVVPQMQKKFGYKNTMQVPKLEKIVLNAGVGDATQNSKVLDSFILDVTLIAGQKPLVTRAKKSIASFKLRQNMPIGCMVTMRRKNMYFFFDRLVNIAIPRIRDFQGVSRKSFDGRGNYTLGVREQIIFPEIDYDKVDRLRGFNVTIVTTAKTDEEAQEFLSLMGVPFRKTK